MIVPCLQGACFHYSLAIGHWNYLVVLAELGTCFTHEVLQVLKRNLPLKGEMTQWRAGMGDCDKHNRSSPFGCLKCQMFKFVCPLARCVITSCQGCVTTSHLWRHDDVGLNVGRDVRHWCESVHKKGLGNCKAVSACVSLIRCALRVTQLPRNGYSMDWSLIEGDGLLNT